MLNNKTNYFAQSCGISTNFSQLGLQPRRLSIRRYSALFRRIIVECPVIFSRYRKEEASLESAAAAATDVTTAMMAVKIELEEKKRTNELLQRALVSSKKDQYRLTYFKHKALLVGVEVLRRLESC